jgi:hypothetical protein
MPLIGYARVSTDEQDTFAQLGELQRVGCATIFEDRASGASRSRPKLASALAAVGQGDTLVVVRIDRLARSLSHLLEMVEGLRAKGAYFRSINDPIDTSSPQGMLMTQMLGAFAEFERALIRERSRNIDLMSFTSARLGCFRLGMVPPSSACWDVHPKPAHPMTNRANCPGLSEMPVRDFLKSLSATYQNRCPGLSETRRP